MPCPHYENYAIRDTDSYAFVAFLDICHHCQIYTKHSWGATLEEEVRTLTTKDRLLFCEKCLEPRTIRQLNPAIMMNGYKFVPVNEERHRQSIR